MKKFEITVRNRLVTEKRDMNVYHHADRSANLISHSSSITIALNTVEEDDYLHISVVRGPGKLKKHCVIDLPSRVNFNFSLVGNGTITHSNGRNLLAIPPGPPVWQLRITLPSGHVNTSTEDYITIGDSEHAEDEA